MKTKHRMKAWLGTALAACALWACVLAHAGVPHPGIVMYGKVLDESGQAVNTGTLQWTFTPVAGGTPVTLEATLTTIDGAGGPYAYRLVVPFEIAVSGSPVSPGALPLPAATVQYSRAGTLEGTSVTMTHVIDLGAGDAASSVRVDVCIGCKESTATKHSADTNGDYKFSLPELLRTFQLNTATPDHSYHVDPASTDGYATGPGPDDGAPHTGDYDGGADWNFSGREVVRMIDLFTSTPDHAYDVDSTTIDGFKKALKTAKSAGKGGEKSVSVSNPDLIATRVVQGGAVGAPQGQVTVSITIDGADGGISALGVSDALPAGWSYLGASAAAPAVGPGMGAEGTLDFVFFPVPALPFTFDYEVQLPDWSGPAKAYSLIAGDGYFRLSSSESEAKASWEALISAGPDFDVDTDADGISDALEGYGDADGDGVPNYCDVDADNDAWSDHAEANYDGDASYNPYDPIHNPAGTDGNILDSDTNQNGVPDGEELADGHSPVPSPKAVPLTNTLGLALLAVLLGGAVLARRKRPELS